jgi:GMP synthase-like glutamine amidotransferase
MKLGILDAVYKKDIIDGEKEAEKFVNLFKLVNAPFTYEIYHVAEGEFPQTVAACDAYLVTGSPQGVYDEDAWIAPLSDFIRQAYAAQRKLVGICFGHQMIAHSLGGEARKSEKGWGLGLRPFTVHNHKPWLTPALDTCSLNFLHQDQVTTLPAGAELLAGSDHCTHAMYVIGDRVLGIQGHPEYLPEAMKILLDYLGEHDGLDVADALVSVAQVQPDTHTVAQWIVNFLQYEESSLCSPNIPVQAIGQGCPIYPGDI